MAGLDPNAAGTPATFRQIHVKIPTPTFRLPPPKGYQYRLLNDEFLDAHPKGFLLLHNLRDSPPIGKTILVESRLTGELFVNKRLRRRVPVYDENDPDFVRDPMPTQITFYSLLPSEVRFSTLHDPRVDVILPDEQYFPRLYAYGFPNGKPPGHDRLYNETLGTDLFSLYFKHYNGGTLDNLMEMYGDADIGTSIPEPFIWHVIEQLSRAVLFLQMGLTRSDLDRHLAGEAIQPPPHWKPIVHRAITPSNILLHFDNPSTEIFPQLILNNFSHAEFASGVHLDRAHDLTDPSRPIDIDTLPAAWEDMHHLGALFRRLVLAHDERHPPEHTNNGQLAAYRSRVYNLAPGEAVAYSGGLIALLGKWEFPAQMDPAGTGYLGGRAVHDVIPGPRFLLHEVLPLAVRRVQGYVRKGYGALVGEGCWADVSWVRPDPAFEFVPWASREGTEKKALEDMRRQMYTLWGPYAPVWYSYWEVGVSRIPGEARVFYSMGGDGGDDCYGDADGDGGDGGGGGSGTGTDTRNRHLAVFSSRLPSVTQSSPTRRLRRAGHAVGSW